MHNEVKTDGVQASSAAKKTEKDTSSCRTFSLVPSFSICLSDIRYCPYAVSFGHQYLCRHPDHAKFIVRPEKKK